VTYIYDYLVYVFHEVFFIISYLDGILRVSYIFYRMLVGSTSYFGCDGDEWVNIPPSGFECVDQWITFVGFMKTN
jgi:hypothetical protein